ncbi:hypothetical protein Sjap_001837 [Stephania japonica]|uniref:Uncharacterized protein n=1 Tax=Stephania japonica TaxID=461633 RepID=A0AAP0PS27_9MAGN
MLVWPPLVVLVISEEPKQIHQKVAKSSRYIYGVHRSIKNKNLIMAAYEKNRGGSSVEDAEMQSLFTDDSPREKKRNFPNQPIKGLALALLLASIAFIFFSFSNQSSKWFLFRCQRPYSSTAAPSTSAPVTLSNNRPPNSNYTPQKKSITNISHILFGIGGSAKTWKDRKHYSELWWKAGIMRGFVWLDEDPTSTSTSTSTSTTQQSSWPPASPPYRVSKQPDSRFNQPAVRIARIVLESFRLGLPNVRWFVMGDDDTVFFAHNLVSVLSKYDHRQMYYVGGNSESVEQDVMHSYGMAFGGGGFAISYALAAELHNKLDGCIGRYSNLYGSDERIMACLSEIGVPLTPELGFHQVDIREDPYGLLAAHPLAPLVSLHHLDAVNPLFPTKTQLESLKKLISAYEADPGRTLQQSFCHDHKRNWSVSLSWAYTVQIYPYLMSARDLGIAFRTFKTWRSWSDGPFTFNTRPISADPCVRPLVYFLDHVTNKKNNNNNNNNNDHETLSTYRRHVADSSKFCERKDYHAALAVNVVNVTAPKMERDEWEKAPRRQCCEILNGNSSSDGADQPRVLHIKISRCE